MGKTVDQSEKMVRTSVTIPESMKEEMVKMDVNWSAVMREAIRRKLEWELEKDTVEAVLINEKLKRKAPAGWDSTRVIRAWRSRRQ